MKKKIISIVVCILVITTIFPMIGSGDGNTSEEKTPDWWSMFGHDPQHTGFSTSKAPENNIVNWTLPDILISSRSLAIVDSRIYFGSDRNVYCVSALNGTKIWNFTTGDTIQYSSPAVVNGKVYIGSNDYNMYCLYANNGTKIWNYTTDSYVQSSPVIVDERVYFGSADYNLYCLYSCNGTKIWNYSTTSYSISSSPLVADNKVYFAASFNLFCLHTNNGTRLWNYSVPRAYTVNTYTFFDNKIYFSSTNKNLYCLNASNGTKLWNSTILGTPCGSIAIAYGKIYLGTNAGKLYYFGAKDGEPLFMFSTEHSGVITASAIADHKIYFGSVGDKKLYCLNASDGTHLWNYSTIQTGSPSSPVIADGKLYMFTTGIHGKLYCFGGENYPPATPSQPIGATEGKTGLWYTFSTNTTDPNDDDVSYGWDWTGDSVVDGWTEFYASGETASGRHKWNDPGEYTIRVKAKDIHDNESSWSEPLTITITTPEPDLDCSGTQSWTEVKPGATVNGSFTIKNIGEPNSMLDWAIESSPAWGTWTFTPSSGDDLTPEAGTVTVHVSVVAPNERDTDFTGEVKIVNDENSSDYETIQITLSTPVTKHSIFSHILSILREILQRFPLLEQLFSRFFDMIV